eukprot:CAMPEP_0114139596 /NCGR_PEP_ID=MMETSP0043_2-20121206/16940_1 /TAXON_ID=464988 /ORGANISM="Hemiselmis andersenii, Strain CCMP644" /LENGTH=210 /DNA_ID=CAMNT_0001233643 /DNA_START=197 /DNA_END=829 /DNA_ORIENTATION=-
MANGVHTKPEDERGASCIASLRSEIDRECGEARSSQTVLDGMKIGASTSFTSVFSSPNLWRSASDSTLVNEPDNVSLEEELSEFSEVLTRRPAAPHVSLPPAGTGDASAPSGSDASIPTNSTADSATSATKAQGADWTLPRSPAGLMNARRKHNFLMGLQIANVEASPSDMPPTSPTAQGPVSPLGGRGPRSFLDPPLEVQGGPNGTSLD